MHLWQQLSIADGVDKKRPMLWYNTIPYFALYRTIRIALCNNHTRTPCYTYKYYIISLEIFAFWTRTAWAIFDVRRAMDRNFIPRGIVFQILMCV